MENTGLENAETIAWICFILGGIVLLTGLFLGIFRAPKEAAKSNENVAEAKTNLELTTQQLEVATAAEAGTPGAAAAEGAKQTAEAAKSAIEQLGSVVGSLPEHQRFPGMLVLIGAVLMSVGTIQFGGTSIF